MKFPEDQDFVKRGYIEQVTSSLRKGLGKNIAFLGFRKTGKTLLLKRLVGMEKEVNPVYIDLSRISLSPENFSLEFISNIMFWFLGKSFSEYSQYFEFKFLMEKTSSLNNKRLVELLKIIENELQKIKPDQKLVVESAFNFLEELSKSKKVVLCLDNFENILDLNNFSQIKDILSLINFDNKNISFIVASSAIFQLKKLLKNFEIVEIKNFDKKQTKALANNFGIKKDINEIYKLTYGHPYLIRCLCERLKRVRDVKKAFSIELLHENIYRYYEDVYNYHLNRARGKTLLKSILKVLASLHEASLTEISKKIYRSAPVTKALLERLIEVDLISKKDKKFCFNDPILELWINSVFNKLEDHEK